MGFSKRIHKGKVGENTNLAYPLDPLFLLNPFGYSAFLIEATMEWI